MFCSTTSNLFCRLDHGPNFWGKLRNAQLHVTGFCSSTCVLANGHNSTRLSGYHQIYLSDAIRKWDKRCAAVVFFTPFVGPPDRLCHHSGPLFAILPLRQLWVVLIRDFEGTRLHAVLWWSFGLSGCLSGFTRTSNSQATPFESHHFTSSSEPGSIKCRPDDTTPPGYIYCTLSHLTIDVFGRPIAPTESQPESEPLRKAQKTFRKSFSLQDPPLRPPQCSSNSFITTYKRHIERWSSGS